MNRQYYHRKFTKSTQYGVRPFKLFILREVLRGIGLGKLELLECIRIKVGSDLWIEENNRKIQLYANL